MSDEHSLLLAYMVAESDDMFVSSVKLMTVNSPGYVALVEFVRPYAHMFGPPNDETFAGHPLVERGLSPYGVFEVYDSSWLRQLTGLGKPRQIWKPYDDLHHFIFSFHDSTFECVAKSLAVNLREGSLRDVMFEMLAKVQRPR
jgi:hypothetical protein